MIYFKLFILILINIYLAYRAVPQYRFVYCSIISTEFSRWFSAIAVVVVKTGW